MPHWFRSTKRKKKKKKWKIWIIRGRASRRQSIDFRWHFVRRIIFFSLLYVRSTREKSRNWEFLYNSTSLWFVSLFFRYVSVESANQKSLGNRRLVTFMCKTSFRSLLLLMTQRNAHGYICINENLRLREEQKGTKKKNPNVWKKSYFTS